MNQTKSVHDVARDEPNQERRRCRSRHDELVNQLPLHSATLVFTSRLSTLKQITPREVSFCEVPPVATVTEGLEFDVPGTRAHSSNQCFGNSVLSRLQEAGAEPRSGCPGAHPRAVPKGSRDFRRFSGGGRPGNLGPRG